jgi:hypothetical protein
MVVFGWLRLWQPGSAITFGLRNSYWGLEMGYWEYNCVGCRNVHDAALWYYRDVENGHREYLCGAKYNEAKDKPTWQLLESPD